MRKRFFAVMAAALVVSGMEDLEYLEFKVAVLDGDSYDEICISDPVTISFE